MMSDVSGHVRIFGLEMWRYRPITGCDRLTIQVRPWRDSAGTPVVYLNKVFVLISNWVYAVAWKSKKPAFSAPSRT